MRTHAPTRKKQTLEMSHLASYSFYSFIFILRLNPTFFLLLFFFSVNTILPYKVQLF
jgi:hypothetical protein